MKDINNITTGIVVFTNDRKSIVIEKRNTEPHRGLYGLPGGRVQYGENIKDAAIRELMEETGIYTDNLCFVDLFTSDSVLFFVFTTTLPELIPNNIKTELLSDIENFNYAPNVKDAISKAKEIYSNAIINEGLQSFISATIQSVSNNMIYENKQYGWDHNLTINRIGTIGTAIGLDILNLSHNYQDEKKKALNTLLKLQRADGGWGIRGSENKYSTTLSTCACINAIYREGSIAKKKMSSLADAQQWLLNTQNEDGSWGYNDHEKIGVVSSTCIAIESLLLMNSNADVEKGIKWLLSKQNEDGGWGFKNEAQSKISATSEALILLDTIPNIDTSLLCKAIKWLSTCLESQNIKEELESGYISAKNRFELKHSSTEKALLALFKIKDFQSASLIYPALEKIIRKRNSNSFWEYNSNPDIYPIWHTYDILKLLNYISKGGDTKHHDLSCIYELFMQAKIQLSLINKI